MASYGIRNWRGAAIEEAKRRGIETALYMGGSHVLNKSTAKAPKDEGVLIQTAGVSVDVDAGKANIYYTQKYAARLHENPQFKFQGGRQGKFLEEPLLSESDVIARIFGDALRGEFGG